MAPWIVMLVRSGLPPLLDISFQNREQFPKFALPFGGVGCAFDAIMRVLMDDDLGKRLESLARGNNLSQDFRAVDVFVDHALDGCQLARDFPQANLERLLFLGRMRVMC